VPYDLAARSIAGLSLCSGVGGLDIGIKLALGERYQTVCYVEREAYCAAVLVARMADKALDQAPIWDDLTTFPGKRWRSRVDLVSAGFPCQPASSAGRRKGRQDERWLWPHIRKLLCEVGPRYIYLENVRGLLSVDDGHGFGEVLGDLADLGFDAQWDVFRASDVGAPHRRERVFILAYARSGSMGRIGRATPGTETEDGGRSAQDRDGVRCIRESMAHADDLGRQRLGSLLDGERETQRDDVDGCGDGTLGDTDIPRLEGRQQPKRERRDEFPTWPPGPEDDAGWRRVLAVRPDLTPALGNTEGVERWNIRSNPSDGRGWNSGSEPRSTGRDIALDNPDGDVSALGRDARRGRWEWESVSGGERSGSATQPELRRLDDGLAPRVDRLRAAGNGVVPQQAALAFRELWGRMMGSRRAEG